MNTVATFAQQISITFTKRGNRGKVGLPRREENGFAPPIELHALLRGRPYMTSAQMGGGGTKKCMILRTNSTDVAYRGGHKIPKFCGRHIWKPLRPIINVVGPSFSHSVILILPTELQ